MHESDESLPIVSLSPITRLPCLLETSCIFSNAQLIVSLTQKNELSFGNSPQPCSCYSFLRSLALTVWRWAVIYRPSACCTKHAYIFCIRCKVLTFDFIDVSAFQRSFNTFICVLSRNSWCKYISVIIYTPNFFTCIYEQLLNTSYQQAKWLIIKYAILKLLISTKWNKINIWKESW